MKLLGKHLERNGTGRITVIPEEEEDMWHIYNLVQPGDNVRSSTVRRVQSESSTGSVDSQRMRITLTVEVESVDYDTQAATVSVKGRNTSENKYVKMGAYHTMDLELNNKLSIEKAEWDIISLERVEIACDIARRAEVAAVVLQEGLANVCLLTEHMTIVRQRIETPIPRKRRGSTTNRDKGMQRFFEQVYQAILRHVDFSVVKGLIVASPGFVKDQLFAYIMDQATKTGNRTIFDNKSKFLLIHATSGHKHALTDLLQDPSVLNQLSDTKFAQEARTMDRFYKMLNDDPDRAYYGLAHVQVAIDRGAVETLMISDNLFRSADVPKRKRFIELVSAVRGQGGKVLIYSSLHVTGDQLNQLSGIAAILNFPIPDMDD
ncbi:Translation factor pelota [Sorochytrium milnesiophthora]